MNALKSGVNVVSNLIATMPDPKKPHFLSLILESNQICWR